MKAAFLSILMLFFGFPIISIADPIEDANSYAVRVKSSVRYAAFFDSAATADGAGFLVDKGRDLILSNAHVAG